MNQSKSQQTIKQRARRRIKVLTLCSGMKKTQWNKNKRSQGGQSLRKKQALDSKKERERWEVLTSSESFDETSSSSPKVLKHIFCSASLHMLARKHRRWFRWECMGGGRERNPTAKDRFFILFSLSFSGTLYFGFGEREREREIIYWERGERTLETKKERLRGGGRYVVSDYNGDSIYFLFFIQHVYLISILNLIILLFVFCFLV